MNKPTIPSFSGGPQVHTVVCFSLDREIEDEIEVTGGLEREAITIAKDVFSVLHEYQGLVIANIKGREVLA